MTTDSDFKALVRARMAQTGQTYTAARGDLVREREAPAADLPADVAARQTEADPGAGLTEDERFRAKTIRAFFDGPRLRAIPARRRARVVVLLELLRRFEVGRVYPEREVNELLRLAHEDVASLRRELVDYRYLERADGRYWVSERTPDRDANEAQEVPADEAELLSRLRRDG